MKIKKKVKKTEKKQVKPKTQEKVEKIAVEKKVKDEEESSSDENIDDDDIKIVDPIKSNDKIIKSMEKDSENSEDEKDNKKGNKKTNTKETKAAATTAEEEDKKFVYDKEDEPKTVFCGNIPNSTGMNQTKIKTLFSQYGAIKSVRMRSETGNVIFSKKNKKQCSSFNAYVVFEKEEDAKNSIQLNGYKLMDNHLRVNMANTKGDGFSNKGTIFIGNLSFDATEQEVHEYFESQVGDIEYVRKIPKKGIAYVCFKKGVNLAKALKLNEKEFQGRKLRISRYESKQKQEKKKLFKRDEKTGRIVKRKVKKSHKINEHFVKGRQNINNPIIKKIKESQKATYNKFTESDHVSKKDMFRRGGKVDKDNREVNRDKSKKKQKFFGSKVDGIDKKSKKGKAKNNKTAKEHKVIAKKLKSAASRMGS